MNSGAALLKGFNYQISLLPPPLACVPQLCLTLASGELEPDRPLTTAPPFLYYSTHVHYLWVM